MISVKQTGNFNKCEKFLSTMKKRDVKKVLEKYGKRGVDMLSSNTPVDSGATASMWGYEVHSSHGRYEVVWTNDNINDGVPIAIIIQYGHGTRTGGYVAGVDYINPALRKVFSEMADELWREVENA